MLTAATFFIAFCGGCLLSIFRHPSFGLATYVGLVYIHPPTTWWGSILPSLRWSLIAAAVTLFSVLVRSGNRDGPKLARFGVIWGMVFFVAWLVLQKFWALDEEMQSDLLVIYVKYTLLVILIYKCLDTVDQVKLILWVHAAGCFYLGTIVLTEYLGGRFEGFRGPGLDEANAAALLIVTGVITTFVLFLTGKWYEKLITIGFMPLTLNALVATISRSGFLALTTAGILFNLFTPKRLVRTVRVFSVIGLFLLILITNPVYWSRIGTVLIAGEDVEGVNTGAARVVLIQKQFQMFSDYPLGCGHRCTAVLSPAYLEDRYLTGPEDERARSSHNTFMSLLVEQGIPGAILYIVLLFWIARTTFRLRPGMRKREGLIPLVYTATVASLGAITVGDIFVDYLKFEPRFWFIGLLMVLIKFEATLDSKASNDEDPSVSASVV